MAGPVLRCAQPSTTTADAKTAAKTNLRFADVNGVIVTPEFTGL